MSELTDRLAKRFIVIDGPDGAGKSTQIALLADWLRGQGLEVTTARDPGGTSIGDRIRDILLDRRHEEMVIGCEILLYMASRTQLMGEVIAPALEAGRCVLCDRWVSATIAYQTAEGKASAEYVQDVYKAALQNIWPDLTIILDVPAEQGLARVGDAPDRMESKAVEFHRKVREAFLEQVRRMPDAFHIVGGIAPAFEVQRRIQKLLIERSFSSTMLGPYLATYLHSPFDTGSTSM